MFEITRELFDTFDGQRSAVWCAKVEYELGIKYYQFNEPFTTKVSDFFQTNELGNMLKLTII